MGLFVRDAQPLPWQRPRRWIPSKNNTGTITSSVLALAGAPQIGVTVYCTFFPGAGYADFGNLLPFFGVAQAVSGATNGSGQLVKSGITLGSGLACFANAAGDMLSIEVLTAV